MLGVSTTDPSLELAVEVGDQVRVVDGPAESADLVLAGDAVELLETLSIRRPFTQPVPAGSEWWVQGLLEVFDVSPGAAQ